MLQFYPKIQSYNEFTLAVNSIHTLWVEESGNPHGLPVIFLHGGPGAGCESYHRQFFDPQLYRIVLFDQRGCGRSTPHAELKGNTTPLLVADIECIRTHLKIEKWLVFGGSWGSTLALAYAEAHPQCVQALILRGVFLCRDQDIQWFYQRGAGAIFPEYWHDYIQVIPEQEHGDLVQAYYKRLTSDDTAVAMQAAMAWSVWEGRTSCLKPKTNVIEHFSNAHTALSLARIECHYFVNRIFLRPNQLLEEVERIKNIPGVIVHGRYDLVCPIEQAYALHQAWPIAKFEVAPTSGHSATEPEIVDALIRATREFAAQHT